MNVTGRLELPILNRLTIQQLTLIWGEGDFHRWSEGGKKNLGPIRKRGKGALVGAARAGGKNGGAGGCAKSGRL